MVFLFGAVFVGQKATPFIFTWVSRMRARAAISSGAIIICLVLATMAETVHLAPIVGAFAAGIILAKAEHKLHIEARVKSIADVFIPIFFVMMGARMQIQMFNPAAASGRATLILGIGASDCRDAGKGPGRPFGAWPI